MSLASMTAVMCSIIGYIGDKDVAQILIDGLERLEYRGYDSAGIAGLKGDSFTILKRLGRVKNLSDAVEQSMNFGNSGIGHTRWATHGGVSEKNAHPHVSFGGIFTLVHNGVVENYESIKTFLDERGYEFYSDTDTEVLVNLIEYHYRKEQDGGDKFLRSVQKALLHVRGTYGIAVLCKYNICEIVVARKSSPLLIGIGENEMFIASDACAIAAHTKNVVYLNDGELALLTKSDFSITTMKNEKIDAVRCKLDWRMEDVSLGEYEHFMLKEIYEQPLSLANAMRGRFSDDLSTAKFGGLQLSPRELRQIDRIVFCACGTAWHACLVAEYLIERYARIPVEVEYASEFRYRNAPLEKNTLVFIISQSGETLDSFAAMQEAKRKGYMTLAITNVIGSTIARESDGGIYQHSGPEIGVASTKAFTAQLCIVAMLALLLGRLRDMSFDEGTSFVQALVNLPQKISQVLDSGDRIRAIAEKYAHHEHMLFLGRQLMFPIALEGALKLKEISYIHSEGYPAAEMKHGPIALISDKCPCVFLATQSDILQKTISNIQEVRARGARVLVVSSEGNEIPRKCADDLIVIPDTHAALQPILTTIPLQLFAYYIAKARGCEIDKPRNLAKSVTVE
ncbi:MAG: glutamine--fructose-6-phosphate transaminase (isomerizing) [Puniceicoccales bacterium]|jgi:glucosamine--fructose-6-phosphate aminotransferase (isomerizing)|nr:glutamine--fructose-6-phosphate transaminase (isomerizing) [Puniceicoccales bacterium]